MSAQDLSFVDHIAISCADLNEGVAYIENLLGVQSTVGGVHPRFGTKNHLIKIGNRSFLEVIGPDPDTLVDDLPGLFFIDKVKRPTLTRWIAVSSDLEKTKNQASALGMDIGDIAPASRKRPDGSLVEWKLSDPYKINFDGLMPFFIDWANSAHPADTLTQDCKLIGLSAQSPDHEKAESVLNRLNIGIPVAFGERYQLEAIIECPNGIVKIS